MSRLEVRADADPHVAGASATVDGEPRGTVPLSLELPAGRHLVELAKDGYEPFSSWLAVRAGQVITLTPVLRPRTSYGTLLIEADAANCKVHLDGNLHPDRTPALISNVPAGLHLIEVDHCGAVQWKQTLLVKANETTKVHAEVNGTAVIRVRSATPGARAYLDGSDMGPPPVDIKDVKAGEHIVEIKAPGFATYEVRVKVEPGRAQVIKHELAPLTPGPDALWSAGARAFEAGRYDEAIASFTQLHEHHPTHGRADDALYFTGVAHTKRERWREALDAFLVLARRFPAGALTDDGYYFAAISARHLRACVAARDFLRKIERDFPKSNVRKVSRTLDAELAGEVEDRSKCDPP